MIDFPKLLRLLTAHDVAFIILETNIGPLDLFGEVTAGGSYSDQARGWPPKGPGSHCRARSHLGGTAGGRK